MARVRVIVDGDAGKRFASLLSRLPPLFHGLRIPIYRFTSLAPYSECHCAAAHLVVARGLAAGGQCVFGLPYASGAIDRGLTSPWVGV